MEILNKQSYNSMYAMRLVDTSKHTIINSVPYTKDTNSPIPFNNISLIKGYYTIAGGNAVHPQLNCSGDNNMHYDNTSYRFTIDKKAKNMIIDNNNPNISYVVPSWVGIATAGLDTQLEEGGCTPKIYKITSLENGTIKKEYLNIGYSSPTGTSYMDYHGYIINLTQNDNYIFVFFKDYTNVSAAGASTPIIVKIEKETFNIVDRCYITLTSLSTESYKNGNSINSSGYDLQYYTKQNIRILYETSSGYIFFINGRFANSSGSNIYFHGRMLYFSYDTCQVTDLNIEQGSLTNSEMPIGLPTVYDTNVHSRTTYGAPTGFSQLCHYIPSKYIETENDIYGYYYCKAFAPDASHTTKLYYMNHSKTDFMTMNISEIPMVFPEDSEISQLPDITTVFSAATSVINHEDYRYIYESYTTNHNGVDYVHIFFKGIYNSPVVERGIYTFEINEDRSQATFVSFYRALGGSIHDYMTLTEDKSKIVLLTQTSFHILKFDAISKSWVSVYDALDTVKSMIQTAENKLYYLTNDYNIHMLDLNGAVMIDFNFEKQSYSYNNVDIVSYISIWAKDAEGNYSDTNIKLTITGNAVWQENGLQTLETATSSSGPIEIPFVIKGHTAINVGVDAII